MRGAGRVAGIVEDGEVVVAVALAVVEVDKYRIDGLSRGRVDEVAVVPLSPAANDGEIDEDLGVEGVVVGECLDEGVLDVFVSLLFSFRA